MTDRLDPKLHDLAWQVATWFMPGDDRYPSAQKADPEGEMLDRALYELEASVDEIVEGLASLDPTDVDGSMTLMAETDPAGYELLRILFVGSYLMTPIVWSLLGYTGRRPQPIDDGEAEHHLRDGLLEPARRRGSVYRPTPE